MNDKLESLETYLGSRKLELIRSQIEHGYTEFREVKSCR